MSDGLNNRFSHFLKKFVDIGVSVIDVWETITFLYTAVAATAVNFVSVYFLF